MIGTDFIADTNILLYLLSGNKSIKEYEGSSFGISVITEIELLGWYKINPKDQRILEGLMDELTIFPLNDKIKDKTIKLKQEQKIKTPDAIIGATSQWLKVPLLTADKDFNNVKGIDAIIINIL
jgi:predicted nucleic acid-binding protein